MIVAGYGRFGRAQDVICAGDHLVVIGSRPDLNRLASDAQADNP